MSPRGKALSRDEWSGRLDKITLFIEQKGYPPTYAEIAELWDVSKSAAYYGVKVLESLGRLTVVAYIARGIVIHDQL